MGVCVWVCLQKTTAMALQGDLYHCLFAYLKLMSLARCIKWHCVAIYHLVGAITHISVVLYVCVLLRVCCYVCVGMCVCVCLRPDASALFTERACISIALLSELFINHPFCCSRGTRLVGLAEAYERVIIAWVVSRQFRPHCAHAHLYTHAHTLFLLCVLHI